MNKPLKAALFSAFIFPGAGQLLLKKYISATYYAVFASVGLYLLFSNLMERAQYIIDKVESGEVSANITTITELVYQQSMTNTDSLSSASIIFFVAWIVSVIEAYRIGKKDVLI